MGKEKKEKRKSEGGEEVDDKSRYDEQLHNLSAIANPLASRKLSKKLYKAIKKGG